MLIDINTCFGSSPIRRVAYARVVDRARTFTDPTPADPTVQEIDWSLDNLLRILDRHEVDRAFTYSLLGKVYDPVAGNDETWRAAQQHPQLVPVATLNPARDVVWRDELQRCIDRGFRVFRFFPGEQEWSISGLPFPRIAEALAEHKVTVMLPACGWGQQTAMARMLCPLGLKVIAMSDTFAAIPESAAVLGESTGFFCETSGMCGGGSIETIVGAVGADGLLFGSNSPEYCFEAPYNLVARAKVAQADRDKILGLNALRLLDG